MENIFEVSAWLMVLGAAELMFMDWCSANRDHRLRQAFGQHWMLYR